MKATVWVFERRRSGLFLTSRSDPATVVIGCFSRVVFFPFLLTLNKFHFSSLDLCFIPKPPTRTQEVNLMKSPDITSCLHLPKKEKYTLKRGEYTSTVFVLYVLPRRDEVLRPRQRCLYVRNSFNQIIINLD